MKLPAVLLAALAIAACNKQDGNMTGGNGGQAAAPATIRPGLWETTTRIVSVAAPTAPPEVKERLQASLSEPPTVERACVTPAEAANLADNIRTLVMRDQPGYVCETGETLFAGGRVRMTLTCRSTTGAPGTRQAMAGSFTAETMQLAVSGEGATPATEMMQSIPVRVDTTLVSRRVGDCPSGTTN